MYDPGFQGASAGISPTSARWHWAFAPSQRTLVIVRRPVRESHFSGLTQQVGWHIYVVAWFGGGQVNISILHRGWGFVFHFPQGGSCSLFSSGGSCSPNFVPQTK